jgi:hypothetical protein
MDDFSHQHQHDQPPPLSGVEPRLAAAVGMMLRKTPAARPSLLRVISILSEASSQTDPGGGFAALASAGAAVAARETAAEIRQSTEASGKQSRDRLAEDAKLILRDIVDNLFDRICKAAPTATSTHLPLRVRLGEANLRVSFLGQPVGAGAFAQSNWDVVAGATISIQQAQPPYEWSASLWYGRLTPAEDYRWYEVSYFVNPLARSVRERHAFAPFALTDDIRHADEAAAPVIGTYQFASKPKPIDLENAEDFCNRWASLLAQAAEGKLSYPRNLPLP